MCTVEWFDQNRSFWQRYAQKRFYVFVPGDLDLWPSDIKSVPPVTLVQRYVSTKSEVTMTFLLRENRRHGTDGQTDGIQRLTRLSRQGRIIRQYRASRKSFEWAAKSERLRTCNWFKFSYWLATTTSRVYQRATVCTVRKTYFICPVTHVHYAYVIWPCTLTSLYDRNKPV